MVNVRRRPLGWHEFLRAIATLNIPLSTVSNCVKDEINLFKNTGASGYVTPTRTPETPMFRSPILDTASWLSF
uniref:Uncharacterized protein n=1 Tax=Anguilla anguilla TaxID=7936 RepID=A0A0E9V036_ANGAN